MNAWTELPDIDEVKEALVALARCKAALRVAELDLEIEQQLMAQRAPRSAAVKVVGVDEETRARLYALQVRVIMCKEAVDAAEVEVQFNKERMNNARSLHYKR